MLQANFDDGPLFWEAPLFDLYQLFTLFGNWYENYTDSFEIISTQGIVSKFCS